MFKVCGYRLDVRSLMRVFHANKRRIVNLSLHRLVIFLQKRELIEKMNQYYSHRF
jgi:hypothetical protein